MHKLYTQSSVYFYKIHIQPTWASLRSTQKTATTQSLSRYSSQTTRNFFQPWIIVLILMLYIHKIIPHERFYIWLLSLPFWDTPRLFYWEWVCMHVFVCACTCTRVYNRVWVCSSGQQYSLLNHEPPSTLLDHRHMPLSQLQHTISIEEIHWNLFSPFFKQQRGISSWGYNENHYHKHRWVFQTCLLVCICVFSSRHTRASAHITHVIRCAHHQPHMDTSTFLSD